MQVITLLEDTIEMKEEDNEPAVGSCFEGNIHVCRFKKKSRNLIPAHCHKYFFIENLL